MIIYQKGRLRLVRSVGLRTEILITLTLLLGAALLLGGIMMLHLMEKSLLEERVGQLNSFVTILSQSLSIQNGDRNLLRQLPDGVNCKGWWFYDQNLGLVDSFVSGERTQLTASRRQLVRITGEQQRQVDFPFLLNFFDKIDPAVHFIVPIANGSHFSGLLELYFSLADIRAKLLKSQQLVLLYILLYGAVLVLAGYYLLQRNIIKPVRILFKATEDVSRGNLETRLPTTGPAEIAQLAVAYNQMVEALQQSHAEAEKHILSLEKTNRQLQKSRNELVRSEKMSSVGQLAAGLAHELGNPLAALIGYLEFLNGTIKASSSQDIIERSLVEATRIDFLVRELLNFSRPDDQSYFEAVDLAQELRGTVQLLQNQGTLARITVTDRLPDFLPAISLNRNKVQQVFVNILLNAIQSCGSEGEVSLSAGTDVKSVWLGIKDNGCGIAAADLLKIFEPFFTTKPSGQGTGLGLAMCQRIIEEAGGEIEVESILGEGSFFRLIFLR